MEAPKKKSPHRIVSSSLWQWTLHIKPQPVSSVTCIIMSKEKKTLYYPRVADSSRWASGCRIWMFLFQDLHPHRPHQKVTSGVKPVSNSHLPGFIAMESLGVAVLGSGEVGYWGCHIESHHQSCVIDRVALAARDQGPGGIA